MEVHDGELSNPNRKRIISLEDIKHLVDTFYKNVQKDDLIGPIFDEVIQDNWPLHLQKMYAFWQTVLLEEHTYFGTPFMPHLKLPITPAHFERWLLLFNATVDELFEGDIAQEAKWRADRMATMFMSKLDYYRKNANKPLM